MKVLLVIPLVLILSSCNESADMKDKIYLSCKISSSHATQEIDRETDLSQCWDTATSGYESQVSAVELCDEKVSDYISSQYDEAHTVTYIVQDTYCTETVE